MRTGADPYGHSLRISMNEMAVIKPFDYEDPETGAIGRSMPRGRRLSYPTSTA